ncbi:hypothetical protein [Amycolatopsis echigonensis]|uniref:hypothetical protein n=1 Tax=Amycolatopsis echigonensis TaxID=2576905 RepID=UPI0011781072|nr:hypothetical protein [Amycolatopsis niigatensis]
MGLDGGLGGRPAGAAVAGRCPAVASGVFATGLLTANSSATVARGMLATTGDLITTSGPAIARSMLSTTGGPITTCRPAIARSMLATTGGPPVLRAACVTGFR